MPNAILARPCEVSSAAGHAVARFSEYRHHRDAWNALARADAVIFDLPNGPERDREVKAVSAMFGRAKKRMERAHREYVKAIKEAERAQAVPF
jgi:hypothetical protein